MLNNELMLGVGGSLFEPDGTVTRAQLAMVLYRVAGKPDVKNTANPFKDVTEGVWYADAVKWAAEVGVVKGISADEFAPEVPVTRQEIATMLYRFAKAEAVAEDKLAAFPDAASVADWAKDAMNWAVGHRPHQRCEGCRRHGHARCTVRCNARADRNAAHALPQGLIS